MPLDRISLLSVKAIHQLMHFLEQLTHIAHIFPFVFVCSIPRLHAPQDTFGGE
jgi:hypothetical protein